MKFHIKSFALYISYPCLALVSLLICGNLFTDYLLCFFAVVLHELCHVLMMKLRGVKICGISISAFDIRIIERGRYSLGFSSDLLVTLSGPFVNILLFLVFCDFSFEFAVINLFLGLYNLLPAAGLDGGQMLFLILSKRFSPAKSAFITDIVTVVISVPMFIVGLAILFYSKYNFSMLFISLYLILTVFLKEDKYL